MVWRWAWHILASACLLACLTAAALWVVMQRRWLEVWRVTEHEPAEALTGSSTGESGTVLRRRGLVFDRERVNLEVKETFRIFENRPPVRLMPPGEGNWEVRWGSDDLLPHGEEEVDPTREGQRRADVYVMGNLYLAEVPYWQPLLVTGLPPLVWLGLRLNARRRAARDRAAGRCPVCGYDLRATPEKCPECGCNPAGAG